MTALALGHPGGCGPYSFVQVSYCACCIVSADWPQEAFGRPGDCGPYLCVQVSYCACCAVSADWPQEAQETGPYTHVYRYLTVHVVLFQLTGHKKPRRLVPVHVYRYLTVHVALFQLMSPGDWSLLMCMGILVYMLHCFS